MAEPSSAPEQVEVAFALEGERVPPAYRAPLADALVRRLPWLREAPVAGVHGLNLVRCGEGELRVSPRTRLVLRVPRERAADALALEGAELVLEDGSTLRPARPRTRELLPHGTLYAPLVLAEGRDEPAFVGYLRAALAALDVAAEPVCGRWQSAESGTLVGCSVMLSGLAPERALRVLQEGVGPHRLLGCGLFVPHRSAAAVGAPA